MEQREVREQKILKQQRVTTGNVNLSYLQELAGGDDEFVIEIIEMFIADTPGILQQIQTYAKVENYEMLKITVHKLKSSVKMLGDTCLADLMQHVENCSDDKPCMTELNPYLQRIHKGSTALIHELEGTLGNLK